MIIAGPCLWNIGDDAAIKLTADNLKGTADYFRVKLWGGGTTPEKYFPGIGNSDDHLKAFKLTADLGNVITEVQTPEHIASALFGLSGVWIGARNCHNYGLIEKVFMAANRLQFVGFKRGPGVTIAETIDLYRLYTERGKVQPWIIERGINTIDRGTAGRWSPDLKIAYYLKHERPEIFDRLVIDCSHSAGEKRFVFDVYHAFKAIGCKNFMFECLDGDSKTDRDHMMTTSELKEGLK